MKKKRKSRGLLYAVMSVLLAVGAIGGVAAKELTSKPYDAPDLHLVMGSENYDLLEGIIYDSDTYDLAVKDTGEFNIQQVGKYEVSYTLTLKGQSTVTEETQQQNLEGEPSAQTESATGTAGEADAAIQSADQSVDTEAGTAEVQNTENSNAQNVEEPTPQEEGNTEETILFKRNVYVQSEDTSAKYLIAKTLEIETGSTNYDLFEDLELRDASGEKVEDNIDFSLTEGSKQCLDDYTMTGNELAEYIEEMEKKGEEPAAAQEAAIMSAQEGDNEDITNPPLKAGVYAFEMEATDEETGETYTATRSVIVRDVKENYNLTFQAGAYADRVKPAWKEQQIDTLLGVVDSDANMYIGPAQWQRSYQWPAPSKHYVRTVQSNRSANQGGHKNNNVVWGYRTHYYEQTMGAFEGVLGGKTSYEFFEGKVHRYQIRNGSTKINDNNFGRLGLVERSQTNNGYVDANWDAGNYGQCCSYPNAWRATPYHVDGDWNNLLGMLPRDKQTLKEGGEADAI